MKLKYEFTTREIVGEKVLVPQGEGALKFSGMMATSDTGAFLFSALKQDVTRDELAQMLMNEYEVDEQTAYSDLDEFLAVLNKLNLLA